MSKRTSNSSAAAKRTILQSYYMRKAISQYSDMMDFTKPPSEVLYNPLDFHKENAPGFCDISNSKRSFQDSNQWDDTLTKEVGTTGSHFNIFCNKVVVGKLATIPLYVRFQNEELHFRCPDYFFGKLYTICVKMSDIASAQIYLGQDFNVVFLTIKFSLGKVLSKFLLHPHGESGSVCPHTCEWCRKKPDELPYTSEFSTMAFYVSNDTEREKLAKMSNHFRLITKTHITIGQVHELQKRHVVDIQATNEKMKALRGPSAPAPKMIINNIATMNHSDYWEDPRFIRVPMAPKQIGYQQNQKKQSAAASGDSRRGDKIDKRIPASKPKYPGIRSLSKPNVSELTFPNLGSSDEDFAEEHPQETQSASAVASGGSIREDNPDKRTPPTQTKYLSIGRFPKNNVLDLTNDKPESSDDDFSEKRSPETQIEFISKMPVQGRRVLRSTAKTSGTKEVTNMVDDDEDTEDKYYVVFPPPPQAGSIAILKRELECLKPRNWINDTVIDFWFKFVFLRKCSVEDQERILFFSSYFCTLLAAEKDTTTTIGTSLAERKYQRAKRWTRNQDLFVKDFLVFPVHHSDHWFMAVVCFPGDILQSCGGSEESSVALESQKGEDATKGALAEEENDSVFKEGMLVKRPCIIIFDSLHGTREESANDLRMFLEMECKVRKDCNVVVDKRTMPTLHPKVPLQDNHFDCGIFVLQFLETFCETLLKNFEVPIVSLEDWFSPQVVQGKRKELLTMLQLLHEEQADQEYLMPKDKIIMGRYD